MMAGHVSLCAGICVLIACQVGSPTFAATPPRLQEPAGIEHYTLEEHEVGDEPVIFAPAESGRRVKVDLATSADGTVTASLSSPKIVFEGEWKDVDLSSDCVLMLNKPNNITRNVSIWPIPNNIEEIIYTCDDNSEFLIVEDLINIIKVRSLMALPINVMNKLGARFRTQPYEYKWSHGPDSVRKYSSGGESEVLSIANNIATVRWTSDPIHIEHNHPLADGEFQTSGTEIIVMDLRIDTNSGILQSVTYPVDTLDLTLKIMSGPKGATNNAHLKIRRTVELVRSSG